MTFRPVLQLIASVEDAIEILKIEPGFKGTRIRHKARSNGARLASVDLIALDGDADVTEVLTCQQAHTSRIRAGTAAWLNWKNLISRNVPRPN